MPLDHGFHTYRQMQRWTVSPAARVEILDRLLAENHRRAALQGAAPAATGRRRRGGAVTEPTTVGGVATREARPAYRLAFEPDGTLVHRARELRRHPRPARFSARATGRTRSSTWCRTRSTSSGCSRRCGSPAAATCPRTADPDEELSDVGDDLDARGGHRRARRGGRRHDRGRRRGRRPGQPHQARPDDAGVDGAALPGAARPRRRHGARVVGRLRAGEHRGADEQRPHRSGGSGAPPQTSRCGWP